MVSSASTYRTLRFCMRLQVHCMIQPISQKAPSRTMSNKIIMCTCTPHMHAPKLSYHAYKPLRTLISSCRPCRSAPLRRARYTDTLNRAVMMMVSGEGGGGGGGGEGGKGWLRYICSIHCTGHMHELAIARASHYDVPPLQHTSIPPYTFELGFVE